MISIKISKKNHKYSLSWLICSSCGESSKPLYPSIFTYLVITFLVLGAPTVLHLLSDERQESHLSPPCREARRGRVSRKRGDADETRFVWVTGVSDIQLCVRFFPSDLGRATVTTTSVNPYVTWHFYLVHFVYDGIYTTSRNNSLPMQTTV